MVSQRSLIRNGIEPLLQREAKTKQMSARADVHVFRRAGLLLQIYRRQVNE